MKTALIFALGALLAGSAAFAQEKPVPLKDAPGRPTVENMCSGCHSLDYIRTNAPFMSRQTWTAEVNKMIKKERVMLQADLKRMHAKFSGLRNFTKKPDFLIIIDPSYEHNAVKEARFEDQMLGEKRLCKPALVHACRRCTNR